MAAVSGLTFVTGPTGACARRLRERTQGRRSIRRHPCRAVDEAERQRLLRVGVTAVRTRSSAAGTPINRGTRWVPPAPGRPRFASGPGHAAGRQPIMRGNAISAPRRARRRGRDDTGLAEFSMCSLRPSDGGCAGFPNSRCPRRQCVRPAPTISTTATASSDAPRRSPQTARTSAPRALTGGYRGDHQNVGVACRRDGGCRGRCW